MVKMETYDEKLSDKVDELFEQIEVKPRYEAVRIGRRSADKTRPIKISVTNSNNVHEILLKSKNLRLSQLHKTVKFTMSGLKQYLNTEGIYTNNPNKCVYVCVYTVRDVCL